MTLLKTLSHERRRVTNHWQLDCFVHQLLQAVHFCPFVSWTNRWIPFKRATNTDSVSVPLRHHVCIFLLRTTWNTLHYKYTLISKASAVSELLTHWGRVTHICVSKLTTIASDNGLSPGRRQAIIWTNDGILLIWPLGTNFSEILIEIHSFSFKKMNLKMSSGKMAAILSRPQCVKLVMNERLYWQYFATFY